MNHCIELADDHVLLERIEEKVGTLHLIAADPRNSITRATVVGVGPGEQRPNGERAEMPCKVGDTILIPASAGTKFTLDGTEYWVVSAAQRYIIGALR